MIGSILVAPVRLIFWLVRTIFSLTGRTLAIILGFAFIVVGLFLTLTIVGAIVGIPLILIGLGLIAKGLT